MSAEATAASFERTPLYALHVALGARITAFAGYEMPVHYPLGVLKEHLHTRAKAGLFDVSHMGQARLVAADGGYETAARALETLVPADILNLKSGQQRYTQLLNDRGGIIDDLMVTRPSDAADNGALMLVLNASRKGVDADWIASRLPAGVRLELLRHRALIALQGPCAKDVMARLCPAASELAFMTAMRTDVAGIECYISRSGYTGEDGFEIALPADRAEELARALLQEEGVEPIGLGARDSLRLEAGLCLYGHDIDETTSPIEAALAWSIQKRRRAEGGFPGAERIQQELRDGPARLRVGILPAERAPAREGTIVVSEVGDEIGKVTSGGFGPTLNHPIAMGYVTAQHARSGTPLRLMIRGKSMQASVVELPFVPNRYFRKTG